jgi:hypothetical protein
MYQILPSGERHLLPRDEPFLVRERDVGTTLEGGEVIREHIYRAGDTVSFSATELSEIIFFYQVLAMQIGGETHSFFNVTAEKLNT